METDKSPWNWLLLVPIVIPFCTFIYNGTDPYLFGFPRFYWLQLSFVGLGALCAGIVYRRTRKSRKRR
jgi:hypothetical protein